MCLNFSLTGFLLFKNLSQTLVYVAEW